MEDALDLLKRPYGPDAKEKLSSSECRVFGKLCAFDDEEFSQLSFLYDLITRYVEQRSPPRPLCVGVFGPPGSGKSFAVKAIREQIEDRLKTLKLPMTTVNLTQVAHSNELGRVLGRIAGEQDEQVVPLIFFDEFDAARGGAEFGWLGWFLAPMHDGEFLHEGAIIRLKRAIFIFAGGTAATMQEFADAAGRREFRLAKGPDFVSRLRGYLNVEGPNAEPRPLRRAVVLRKEIQDHVTRLGCESLKADAKLMESLLRVGRYRHGARSIGAVIELSTLKADDTEFHGTTFRKITCSICTWTAGLSTRGSLAELLR